MSNIEKSQNDDPYDGLHVFIITAKVVRCKENLPRRTSLNCVSPVRFECAIRASPMGAPNAVTIDSRVQNPRVNVVLPHGGEPAPVSARVNAGSRRFV